MSESQTINALLWVQRIVETNRHPWVASQLVVAAMNVPVQVDSEPQSENDHADG